MPVVVGDHGCEQLGLVDDRGLAELVMFFMGGSGNGYIRAFCPQTGRFLEKLGSTPLWSGSFESKVAWQM